MMDRETLQAIIREFDEADDFPCPHCSRLVMCRFHSLMSMLKGRTAPTSALAYSASSPRVETVWQPIDTAPKDKTEVDLWVTYQFGIPHRTMNAWLDSQGVWLRWATDTDGRYPTPVGGHPTHWCPVPASPSPEPAQDGARETVTRYDSVDVDSEHYTHEMQAREDGDWVRYEDFARLTSLLAQAEQDAKQWEALACESCACVWEPDAIAPKKECVYHGALRKAAIQAEKRAEAAEAESARLVARLAGALSPKADA